MQQGTLNSWVHVVQGRSNSPQHIEVEEVVEANLLEEITKLVQELNMKVMWHPTPSHPPPNPMQTRVYFIRDTLSLPNSTLESVWFVSFPPFWRIYRYTTCPYGSLEYILPPPCDFYRC